MPNVVRIQLRGAAGLGSAQTTRIPNGEGEREIDGPSRVSCNAELASRYDLAFNGRAQLEATAGVAIRQRSARSARWAVWVPCASRVGGRRLR